MNFIFRISLYIFLTFLALLTAVAAALYFAPEKILGKLKPHIESAASEALDADISYDDISLLGFPNPDIMMTAVKIAPHGSERVFRADSFEVRLDLFKAYSVWKKTASRGSDYLLAIDSLAIENGTSNLLLNGENKEIKLTRAISKLSYDQAIIKLSDSDLNVEIDSQKISLKSSQDISYRLNDHQLSFQEVILKLPSVSLTLNGEFNTATLEAEVNLRHPDVSFADLTKIVQIFRAPIPDLKGSISSQLIISHKDSLSLKGNIKLTDFIYPATKLSAQALSLTDMNLNLSDQGSIDLNSKASINEFSLNREGATYKIGNGVSAFSLQSINQSMKLSGNSSLNDFVITKKAPDKTAASAEFKPDTLSIKNLSLSSFNLEAPGDGSFNSKTKLGLSHLSYLNQSSSYGLESAESDLIFSNNSNLRKISGNSSIRNFSFSNSDIELKNISARLEEVKIDLGKQGDFAATVNLLGSSLELKTPDVFVSSIQSVNAPLKLSFPSRGDYLISGPVDAKGVNGLSIGRPFENAEAVVAISISESNKTFNTSNLTSSMQGVPFKLGSDLLIAKESFTLKPSTLQIADGSINLTASIGRTNPPRFSLTSSAQDLSIAKLYPLLGITEEKDSKPGVLKSFNMTASGDSKDPWNSLSGDCTLNYQLSPENSSKWSRRIQGALQSIPTLISALTLQKDHEDIGLLSAKMTFGSAAAEIEEFFLAKKLYSIKGNGKVEFNGNLDLKSDLIFMKKAFSSLGLGIAPLGNLFGKLGSINIPLRIEGNFKQPEVSADYRTFLKDNSGITFLGNTASGASDAGVAVYDFLSSPFSRPDKAAKTQTNTP